MSAYTSEDTESRGYVTSEGIGGPKNNSDKVDIVDRASLDMSDTIEKIEKLEVQQETQEETQQEGEEEKEDEVGNDFGLTKIAAYFGKSEALEIYRRWVTYLYVCVCVCVW